MEDGGLNKVGINYIAQKEGGAQSLLSDEMNGLVAYDAACA